MRTPIVVSANMPCPRLPAQGANALTCAAAGLVTFLRFDVTIPPRKTQARVSMATIGWSRHRFSWVRRWMTITMLVTAAQAHHSEITPVAMSQASTATAARLRIPNTTKRELVDASSGPQVAITYSAVICPP